MTESETRFEAGQSGEGSEGCTDAPGGEIATLPTPKQLFRGGKGRPAVDVVVALNDRWAIRADCYQWILSETDGADRWMARKFTYDRDHLIELIRELGGKVRSEALMEIRAWPERHATWWRLRTGRPTPSIAQATHAIARRPSACPQQLSRPKGATFA